MYMQWLLDSLELEAFPRTIIYGTSIKHVSDLYNYLCTENPSNINKVDMFHSETTYEKKSDNIKKLHDGDSDLKLLIATFALEMGIDIANCHAVILFGYHLQQQTPGSWQNWQGRQRIHCFVVVQ